MKNIIFLSLSIFFAVTAFSQKTKRVIITDSIAVWEVRKVGHPLALDSNQVKYFLGATKNHLNELNKINTIYSNDSLRTIVVKESEKNYQNTIKTIFTKEQFEKYRNIQETNKNKFIQNQSSRKINVKSADVGN